MIPQFDGVRADWTERVEQIVERLGRVRAVEEMSQRAPALRRANRIDSVHSSTAIEGNELTAAQVADVANGEVVLAPPREVLEVENALVAYEALGNLDPWSLDDFLRAHRLLTAGLVSESGAFRSVDVELVNTEGEVVHTGSRVDKVPRLVEEMLEWGRTASDHPLVVSSAVHFLIEHVHPFRDGNGRIGRLWQTLILSRWRPIFAWMPTETLIRQHQAGYYDALQGSRDPEIDAGVFVDFMLEVVLETLHAYETRARADVGVNVGANVGVSGAILTMLAADPSLSAATIADRLGKSPRTVERHLADLKAAGRVRREGSAKAGRWVVGG